MNSQENETIDGNNNVSSDPDTEVDQPVEIPERIDDQLDESDEDIIEDVKALLCPYCGKQFKTKKTLKQHIKQSHSSENHACKYCPKVCSSKHNLRNHFNSTHKKIKCVNCLKELSSGSPVEVQSQLKI